MEARGIIKEFLKPSGKKIWIFIVLFISENIWGLFYKIAPPFGPPAITEYAITYVGYPLRVASRTCSALPFSCRTVFYPANIIINLLIYLVFAYLFACLIISIYGKLLREK